MAFIAFLSFLLISLFSVLPIFGHHLNSSPFYFIKNLQDYEKGSIAPALHDLKLYLARFGYLNYKKFPYNMSPENYYFDEDLEAALKRYQNFYRLNPTGKLDKPTVSQMLLPRCGQRDIRYNQPNTNFLHTVSHYKLFPGFFRWPAGKTNLTYAFNLSFPNEYIPPVIRAFDTWALASSGYFTFTRVEEITGADLKIGLERGEHGDGQAFDGPYGIIAHAYAPTDGRFHYDADENWSVGPGPVPSTLDLETVALHEIGHLLGLDHSKDENAIMWSIIYDGSVKGLALDDILGLKALYGLMNGP
uniref:metalloendoproteinase 2-MMP-like n=1 Tax=Erigeron canadensis TaxID=72917 RepID=UPI001CB9D35C|nr:metalloendoproteinase 2-MMP-like [Erigeron canadensis]